MKGAGVKNKTETGFIIAVFAAGGISEKVLLFVKKFSLKVSMNPLPWGTCSLRKRSDVFG